jgi:deoxyadenosine/deoxycytidine kinase
MSVNPNSNSNNHKKFIVIDGLIGAGKTTLINLLVKKYCDDGFNVCSCLEPVDLWQETGALAHFYKDVNAHAYEFQTFAFVTRVKTVLETIERQPDADIYILERSIFTDRHIFVEMLKDKLGPVRMTMYNMWWDMWAKLLPFKPNTWVFLDTSLNEAERRICIRDRSEESVIDIEYQRQLQLAHNAFFDKLSADGEHVIVIGPELMNADFINDASVLDKIATMILPTAPETRVIMVSQ